ncbi:hypothetical protein AVEN_257183-1 [Araneus ventricosus]|uniref:DUF19 domain-containing protein n=1 Tax=Araneus ventricosus TaxID=182803 RepID=A0A4Y2F4N2_ARAVE|nr:hypothetical protein AVEN_257183-1 [Araneus ventricosus]
MYILNIFIIGVTVGLASCDIDCFNKESNACGNEGSTDASSLLGNYCSTFPPYVSCLKRVADKCKIFQKEMKIWLDIATDACTDGTKLNKDLEANMKCISEAAEDAHCDFKEEDFKDVPADKLFCRIFAEMRHCLYRKIRSTCGRVAEESFYAIYEPMNRYMLRIC